MSAMDKRNTIIKLFPGLKHDSDFYVTSEQTFDYNCIAWALGISNYRFWPVVRDENGKIVPVENYDEREDLLYWPDGVARDESLSAFVSLFEHYGFEQCENPELEPNYTKIALYQQCGQCTHAARQLPNGLWTSKLGPLNDIQHGSPQSLEGDFYGKVYCYMKKRK